MIYICFVLFMNVNAYEACMRHMRGAMFINCLQCHDVRDS